MRANIAPRSSRMCPKSVRLDKSYAHIDHLRMHTNRTETRSISIQAPPATVLDVVGDARTLPRWAPNFAESVRAEGDYWRVNDELLINLRVERELGTVDILRVERP